MSLELFESESHIELHRLTDVFFPWFLDYLYTGRIEVENSDVIAELWLADYFDVPMLVEELYDEFFPICKRENFLLILNQAKRLSCITLIEQDIREYWKRYCNHDTADTELIVSILEAAFHSTENTESMN